MDCVFGKNCGTSRGLDFADKISPGVAVRPEPPGIQVR